MARMKDLGTTCRDVRTREVGIQEIHNKVRPFNVELVRRDYVANGGWETFLSYEDPEQVRGTMTQCHLLVLLMVHSSRLVCVRLDVSTMLLKPDLC